MSSSNSPFNATINLTIKLTINVAIFLTILQPNEFSGQETLIPLEGLSIKHDPALAKQTHHFAAYRAQ